MASTSTLPFPRPELSRRRPAPAGNESTGGVGRPRRELAFAAAAVLLAAADTYVVVVVLPSVMADVGLGIDRLQRATPIISGFLLGYTVVLPLLGRLSDAVGRTPVFVGCLVGFATGSLLTATAHSLGVVVAGRALQGLGGGGLVPVTLSLVAERWPPEARGLPLGVVGAVQELGSVLGPLYGAAVVAVSTWRAIFWVNLPLAAALGAGFFVSRPRAEGGAARPPPTPAGRAPRADVVGPVLLALGAGGFLAAMAAPAALANSVTVGAVYNPVVGGTTWSQLTSPLALTSVVVVAAGLGWEALAPFGTKVVLPLRRIPAALHDVDLLGAALAAGFLACIVVLFSTEDPSRQILAGNASVLVPAGVVLLVAFVLRQRHAANPLIPPGVVSPRPAWGSLAVSLALGAALMAALVDIPLFARATIARGSQIDAAAVLIRFLAAVPLGAVVGGVWCRRPGRAPWVAAGGAATAAVAFGAMATWPVGALSTPLSLAGASLGLGAGDLELVACGLGFGLAIAPVNGAMLAAVAARSHGLATSLVVVARTVGMLAGLSALTAVALHRFYQAQAGIASRFVLCPSHPASCPAYDRAATAAVLSELHTVFFGAAVAAGLAAVLSIALLRARGTVPAGSSLVTVTPPRGTTTGYRPAQLRPIPGTAAPGSAVHSEHPGV